MQNSYHRWLESGDYVTGLVPGAITHIFPEFRDRPPPYGTDDVFLVLDSWVPRDNRALRLLRLGHWHVPPSPDDGSEAAAPVYLLRGDHLTYDAVGEADPDDPYDNPHWPKEVAPHYFNKFKEMFMSGASTGGSGTDTNPTNVAGSGGTRRTVPLIQHGAT